MDRILTSSNEHAMTDHLMQLPTVYSDWPTEEKGLIQQARLRPSISAMPS
jgi:hypothetical protein